MEIRNVYLQSSDKKWATTNEKFAEIWRVLKDASF